MRKLALFIAVFSCIAIGLVAVHAFQDVRTGVNIPAIPPAPITCNDSAGQHLNYNGSSYTCGTSTPTGMVTQNGSITAGHMATWNASNVIQDAGAAPPTNPLSGTSTTQTPGLLLAGACNNFTVNVPGATTSQTVTGISAIGGIDVGVGVTLTGAVTSANTVTVHECALVSATPVGAQFRVVVQ